MPSLTITKFCIDFKWDNKKVWALDLPVQEIAIEKLLRHFAFPFWFDDDVTNPWAVIDNPEIHKEHYTQSMETDISYPIDVLIRNGRYEILDGLHRLVKHYVLGNKVVPIRIVPKENIKDILKAS